MSLNPRSSAPLGASSSPRSVSALILAFAVFVVARWTQAANSLQGILSKLGLERQAKQVPSLHEYIATRAISISHP